MAKKQQTKQPTNQDRAIASLVTGIIAMFSFLFWFFGILFGALAVGFGIAAIRGKQDKGRAIAGIVTGASGIVMSIAVAVLLAVVVPKDTTSQADQNRTDDANNIALQISNVVSSKNNVTVTTKNLSTGGFKVIRSIHSSGQPTKTTALVESGENCDGIKNPQDYAVKVLMDDNSEYCTGYFADSSQK
jgi:hypothetical protein